MTRKLSLDHTLSFREGRLGIDTHEVRMRGRECGSGRGDNANTTLTGTLSHCFRRKCRSLRHPTLTGLRRLRFSFHGDIAIEVIISNLLNVGWLVVNVR